ncbi:hypothetical protein ACH427_26150 [Streptomyces sp. NPDC020379]|uniref:hypothetical protein n=1 Tax=Streptomyces sp. NPDC020379 TaxID=3365071 RepID=UPI00379331F5
MKDFIARFLRWARMHVRPRTLNSPQAAATPPTPTPPAPASTPETPDTCGVYAWATARGIDIKPSSPLASCPCTEHARPSVPDIGAYVFDVRLGRVGQVMGDEGLRLQLRPLYGGREWDAEIEDTRPATRAELLSAKVKAANSGGDRGR